MYAALWIVALAAVVTLTSGLARRLGVPAPFALVAVGVLVSLVPGVPEVELSPELVLVGLLPPLLYAAALDTSLVDFRRNGRSIALLSVGLVIVTTFVVGLVVYWVLPVPLAAAFALGAVVAPPDPVAATSIAARVGMPRRLVTILEGEGLVNDATALVALRTAIAAIGGSVAAWRVGVDFGVAVVGGVAIGVVVAYVTGVLRARVHDEIIETVISMITPYVAYLVAEKLHTSGVLAVVTTGLLLAHRTQLMQSASSRIFERTNWATIQFLLENTVFFLIGLQARGIIENAFNSSLPTEQIVVACVAVTAAAIVVRPLWVFPSTYLARLVPRVAARDPRPHWAYPAVISWAGMRGVVTLAAVFVLPTDTPQRDVLILLALVVVGATLLLQGGTLPMLLRWLRLSGPDEAEDVLLEASVLEKVGAAGLARLDQVRTPEDGEDVVNRLRRRTSDRAEATWERLGSGGETPSQAYVRLRLAMIDAERRRALELRDSARVPADVLQEVFTSIDIEETVLDRRAGPDRAERQQELRPPTVVSGCSHIREATRTPTPQTPNGCAECLELGLHWVHLRLCLRCGHVGCCDSSVGRHATGHFHETDHPVMRSFEPGEAWRWCYVDERIG